MKYLKRVWFSYLTKERFSLMQGLKNWWNSVLAIEGAEWIIYPSVLIVLVLTAYYVVQAFRNMAIGGSAGTEDHLGKFRRMRDEGMIAPEEYKKVAGLVPLPELEKKDSVVPVETSAEALSDAARAALMKASGKNSEESTNVEEDPESDEDGESEES